MDRRDPIHTHDRAVGLPAPADERLAALLVDAVEEYAIFALDPDGRVATWNRGAHRIKGYRADEILGQHFSVFYPAEDVHAGKPERELRHAVEHGHVGDEGWRLRKDGSRFWANVTLTAVFGPEGRLEGFAKITRDDTDRKQMEEQVRQLELLTERERIAQAMHTTIVHRIFEASLGMESALKLVHHPAAVQRITAAVTALDDTLRELRSIVLDLDSSGQHPDRR